MFCSSPLSKISSQYLNVSLLSFQNSSQCRTVSAPPLDGQDSKDMTCPLYSRQSLTTYWRCL